MKREPELKLVRAPAFEEGEGGDAPVSAEEQQAANALREALGRDDDPMSHALRAAWAPNALDEGDLDAILARALHDGDARPTRIEQALADALREGLDGARALREEHAIAADLRAAWKSGELPDARNEALIATAFARVRPATSGRVLQFRRALPVTIGAITGVVALAAGVALLFQGAQPVGPNQRSASSQSAASIARASLIRARSTDDLFDPAEKFPVSGEESARIDRIAVARASDLRENRFAMWGVR